MEESERSRRVRIRFVPANGADAPSPTGAKHGRDERGGVDSPSRESKRLRGVTPEFKGEPDPEAAMRKLREKSREFRRRDLPHGDPGRFAVANDHAFSDDFVRTLTDVLGADALFELSLASPLFSSLVEDMHAPRVWWDESLFGPHPAYEEGDPRHGRDYRHVPVWLARRLVLRHRVTGERVREAAPRALGLIGEDSIAGDLPSSGPWNLVLSGFKGIAPAELFRRVAHAKTAVSLRLRLSRDDAGAAGRKVDLRGLPRLRAFALLGDLASATMVRVPASLEVLNVRNLGGDFGTSRVGDAKVYVRWEGDAESLRAVAIVNAEKLVFPGGAPPARLSRLHGNAAPYVRAEGRLSPPSAGAEAWRPLAESLRRATGAPTAHPRWILGLNPVSSLEVLQVADQDGLPRFSGDGPAPLRRLGFLNLSDEAAPEQDAQDGAPAPAPARGETVVLPGLDRFDRLEVLSLRGVDYERWPASNKYHVPRPPVSLAVPASLREVHVKGLWNARETQKTPRSVTLVAGRSLRRVFVRGVLLRLVDASAPTKTAASPDAGASEGGNEGDEKKEEEEKKDAPAPVFSPMDSLEVREGGLLEGSIAFEAGFAPRRVVLVDARVPAGHKWFERLFALGDSGNAPGRVEKLVVCSRREYDVRYRPEEETAAWTSFVASLDRGHENWTLRARGLRRMTLGYPRLRFSRAPPTFPSTLRALRLYDPEIKYVPLLPGARVTGAGWLGGLEELRSVVRLNFEGLPKWATSRLRVLEFVQPGVSDANHVYPDETGYAVSDPAVHEDEEEEDVPHLPERMPATVETYVDERVLVEALVDREIPRVPSEIRAEFLWVRNPALVEGPSSVRTRRLHLEGKASPWRGVRTVEANTVVVENKTRTAGFPDLHTLLLADWDDECTLRTPTHAVVGAK